MESLLRKEGARVRRRGADLRVDRGTFGGERDWRCLSASGKLLQEHLCESLGKSEGLLSVCQAVFIPERFSATLGIVPSLVRRPSFTLAHALNLQVFFPLRDLLEAIRGAFPLAPLIWKIADGRDSLDEVLLIARLSCRQGKAVKFTLAVSPVLKNQVRACASRLRGSPIGEKASRVTGMERKREVSRELGSVHGSHEKRESGQNTTQGLAEKLSESKKAKGEEQRRFKAVPSGGSREATPGINVQRDVFNKPWAGNETFQSLGLDFPGVIGAVCASEERKRRHLPVVC
nr:hypothetical protein TgIb.1880 [Toxoplasma gondii RH]